MKFPFKKVRILLFILLIFSCKQNEKESLIQLVTEWQNKKIVFPETIFFTNVLKDTIPIEISEHNYKILIYVDSAGCTSCKLKIDFWKDFITEVNSISNNSISFLFFFHSHNYRDIQSMLKRERFVLPFCVDEDDNINKLNNFPTDINYQTFLLNRENKVEIIGNPIHNLAVKELYIKYIKECL